MRELHKRKNDECSVLNWIISFGHWFGIWIETACRWSCSKAVATAVNRRIKRRRCKNINKPYANKAATESNDILAEWIVMCRFNLLEKMHSKDAHAFAFNKKLLWIDVHQVCEKNQLICTDRYYCCDSLRLNYIWPLLFSAICEYSILSSLLYLLGMDPQSHYFLKWKIDGDD